MNTATTLLGSAAIVFALATSGAAVAQTTPAVAAVSNGAAAANSATSTSATKVAAGSAGQTSVAASAVAVSKVQKPAGLTRAQVQAEFLEARKNGTLLETEADFDVAQTRKHVAN